MVKFSKSPLKTSLLKLEKPELTNLAVNCFVGNYSNKIYTSFYKYISLQLVLLYKEIMRFMGDYPLAKCQKDVDCIYFILQVLSVFKI